MFVTAESSGMTWLTGKAASTEKSLATKSGGTLLQELQEVLVQWNESFHLKRRLHIRTTWNSLELVLAYNTLIHRIKWGTVKEVDRICLRAMEQERIMEGWRFTADIEDGKENFSVLHELSTSQYNPSLWRVNEFRWSANLRVWKLIKEN